MTKKVFALTTLALLLGSCAPSNKDSGTTKEGGSTATTQSNDGSKSSGGAALPGGKIDTFVIMEGSDIPTLDPGTSYDTASGSLIENMYETLLTYKGNSIIEFEPLLATEWKMSDDGKEYRFTLRKDVKFHTGNPFTCKDVEYTTRRNLVTNTSDSGNWFVAESLLGTGSNAADAPDKVTWEAITKAVKCDGETIVYTLPKVDPAFLSKMAYTGQAIIDSEHAKKIGEWDGTEATWKDWVGKDIMGSELAKKPSGTGAYILSSQDSNNYVFKSFPEYWGGEPPIKNVVHQKVSEASSRIQAFLKGDADFAELGSREVVETQVAGQPGIRIIDDIPSISAFAFTMNQNLEGSKNLGSGTWGDGIPTNFFQDPKMRECFVKSFDSQAYMDQVLRGKGKLRNFLLPDVFLGYDDSIQPTSFDPAGAEAACKAAHGGQAWEKGFTLNTAYREGSQGMQVALEIIKNNIEALNPKFKVNVNGKQWSDILDKKNIEAMVYAGWSPDYADPDNFVHTFYHSKGYYSSKTGIKDKDIDAWIDEARSITDEAKRKELYSKIAKKALDENYFLVMPVGLGISASHERIQGISLDKRNPLKGGAYYWKDLSKTQ